MYVRRSGYVGFDVIVGFDARMRKRGSIYEYLGEVEVVAVQAPDGQRQSQKKGK